jgi:hypothetical protein
MLWPEITADPDPMRLVREARERGEDVRMTTGVDGGTIVVFWYIPSTGHWVMEGALIDGEACR